ncbi:MAG: hypothetical protein V4692_13750 [Bdellovibrionota bacterium]
MNKTLLILLSSFLVTTVCYARESKPLPKSEVTASITEFKFKGAWLHPKIIKEFLPWSADRSYPLITSVDVAAATGTNRYFGNVVSDKKGASYTDKDGETVRYDWAGKLKNGMHVIVAKEFGSGSMVSTTLLIFALRERESVDGKGEKYPQLILEVQRVVSLGDRASFTLKTVNNVIDVTVKCGPTCDSKTVKLDLN